MLSLRNCKLSSHSHSLIENDQIRYYYRGKLVPCKGDTEEAEIAELNIDILQMTPQPEKKAH